MREAAFNNIAPVCALFETDQDFLETVGTFPMVIIYKHAV